MTPERYQRIGRLFDEALEHDLDARAAFLKRACGADAGLRAEVERLLANHSDSQDFLSRPALDVAAALLVPNRSASLAGQRLGRYHILSLIGVGGMGEVYLAEDSCLRRKVALKVLPENIARDLTRLQRFEQEAFAASALNHPSILTIYEFGTEGETHFLAAEFIEGETLRARLQHAHLSLHDVLDIVVQTAQALKAAHQAGIIHRDIKPENIMLRRDGLVKVLDFGLAKLSEANQEANPDATALIFALPHFKTHPNVVLGTPNYMSPEQARGLPVDERTDIFSLGILLYEMLTGKTPFAGETTSDVIAEILKSEPPPPSALMADVPRDLERIVEKTLRKNRDDRYAHINDLLADLRDLKSELDFQVKLERSTPVHTTGETVLQTTGPQARAATNENLNAGTVADARLTTRFKNLLEQIGRLKPLAIIMVVLASALLTGFGAYYFNDFLSRDSKAKPLRAQSEPMKQTRLTTSGEVLEAAVSPDGQFVAYIAKQGADFALYVRQVDVNSTVTVLPPSNVWISQLIFAPDGHHLYYLKNDGLKGDYRELYKVPTLGGAPERIIADVDSAISLAPNGREFTFRREYPDKRQSLIYVANADGTAERVVAERKRPDGFMCGPVWSPDGKTIAAWVNEAVADVREFSLVAINLADNSVMPIGAKRWRWPRTLRWLPEGKDLVVNGADDAGESYQIWQVAYPSGNALRVTNDFNKYDGLSVTADGRSLVTVEGRQNVNIFVAPASDPVNAQQVTSVTGATYFGLAWTPDGQIVYSSNAGGRRDIWIMESDGKHARQLTNDNYVNYNPVVTSDGRFIVYQSERTGRANIWRMNMDGSDALQLTDGDVDLNPSLTPDGRWVVFAGKKDQSDYLGKVSIDGGETQAIMQKFCGFPAVSPDGKAVACEYWIAAYRPSLSVLPITGGEPIRSITPLPDEWQWSVNSRSLVCVDDTAGFSNLFSVPLGSGSPKPLTAFKSDRIFAFALARDGKRIAFVRGSVYSDVVMISNFR